MDLLFLDTYYIDGVEFTKGWYDYFKDLIWPLFTTSIGIISSVLIAKWIFNIERNSTIKNRKKESERLKNIVVRNSKIIVNITSRDAGRMRKVYIEGYDIKKGISHKPFLVSFPELDFINAIGVVKLEECFIKNYEDESKLKNFYLAVAGVTEIHKTYKVISEEVQKINNFLSEYEYILLERFSDVQNFFISKIYACNFQEADVYVETDIHEFLALIKRDPIENNNFYLLKKIVDEIPQLKIFPKIIKAPTNDYFELQGAFTLAYLKCEHEVSLFHHRISYLVTRLEGYGKNLQNFEVLS